jgi:tetratricopeptide (TPR) repeat protein
MTAPQQTEITERLLRIDDPTERKRFLSGNRTLLDLAVVEQLTSAVRRFIRSDPRRAMAIAEIARSVAHLMADPLADALSLRSIAEAQHAQNAYEPALEAYDAAIAIYRAHGRELEATRIERNKIDVLMYMGRYQEALGAAARARDVAERLGESVLAAQIDTHVGNIHHRTDDFRTALTYYERARNVFVEAGDPFARALIDFNRANVLAQLNDFAHSEQLYKSARATFVEREMRVLAAHADYSLAYLLYLQNEFVDAMTVLSDSRTLYTAAQDRRGAANCDLDLAELYLRVNLCEESMAAAEHARTEFTHLRLRYEEAKTTTILAANHLQLGRDQRALELFRHAEMLFRAEGNAVQVAAVAMCRADLLLQRGDPFSACRVIKGSLSVFEAHGAADRACDAELRLAIALRMQGASDLAWEAAERALSRLAEADRPWLSYRVQHLIARMLWERGEIRAAQEHLDRALNEIERLWMDLRIDEFRVPFLRDKEVAFVDAVLLRLEAGGGDAVSAALGNVERCKSRAIVDLLTRRAAPRARVRPGVDPKLYEQYATLRAELDWFWNRLGAGATDARLSARAPRDHFAPEIKRCERALAELRTPAQVARSGVRRRPRLQRAGHRRAAAEAVARRGDARVLLRRRGAAHLLHLARAGASRAQRGGTLARAGAPRRTTLPDLEVPLRRGVPPRASLPAAREHQPAPRGASRLSGRAAALAAGRGRPDHRAARAPALRAIPCAGAGRGLPDRAPCRVVRAVGAGVDDLSGSPPAPAATRSRYSARATSTRRSSAPSSRPSRGSSRGARPASARPRLARRSRISRAALASFISPRTRTSVPTIRCSRRCSSPAGRSPCSTSTTSTSARSW